MTILAGYRYLCKCIDLVPSVLHSMLLYRLLYSVITFVSLITSILERETIRRFRWLTFDWNAMCQTESANQNIDPDLSLFQKYVCSQTRGVLGKGWFDFSPLSLENNGQSQDYCSLDFPEGWRVLPWREYSSKLELKKQYPVCASYESALCAAYPVYVTQRLF